MHAEDPSPDPAHTHTHLQRTHHSHTATQHATQKRQMASRLQHQGEVASGTGAGAGGLLHPAQYRRRKSPPHHTHLPPVDSATCPRPHGVRKAGWWRAPYERTQAVGPGKAGTVASGTGAHRTPAVR